MHEILARRGVAVETARRRGLWLEEGPRRESERLRNLMVLETQRSRLRAPGLPRAAERVTGGWSLICCLELELFGTIATSWRRTIGRTTLCWQGISTTAARVRSPRGNWRGNDALLCRRQGHVLLNRQWQWTRRGWGVCRCSGRVESPREQLRSMFISFMVLSVSGLVSVPSRNGRSLWPIHQCNNYLQYQSKLKVDYGCSKKPCWTATPQHSVSQPISTKKGSSESSSPVSGSALLGGWPGWSVGPTRTVENR